jgi:hypothetical protein
MRGREVVYTVARRRAKRTLVNENTISSLTLNARL